MGPDPTGTKKYKFTDMSNHNNFKMLCMPVNLLKDIYLQDRNLSGEKNISCSACNV